MKNISLGIHLQGLNRQSSGIRVWDLTANAITTGAPTLDNPTATAVQVFLLDTYTGAEAGYSLRKISSTATNSLRVRRSSDNAETDIGFAADGNLDNAALLAFVGTGGTDNGYVTTWYDQSGNANNATQATATNQPQIVSAGNIINSNGYQVIKYDGSNDNFGTSLTATGTMLMGGSDGSALYEVAISGSYSFLPSASITDHPLNESIRVIWGSSLTTAQKTAIETEVTYTDWDFSDVTSFFYYWRQRSELTDFPLIDASSGTNFYHAWSGCSSLTTFPALDLSSGTLFYYSWYNCTSLTSFPLLDVSSGTNFDRTWFYCSGLTSFPALNVSSGTNFRGAWGYCSSLTSFPLLDVSNGTYFYQTWQGCSSLTSFPALNVSSGTNFFYAWYGCSSLQNFPANMFDSVTATDFTNAFLITNLTQTSIDNILTSIDTAGQSGGTFNQSGGSAPSAVGEAAIDNLRARGWAVTVTGGY